MRMKKKKKKKKALTPSIHISQLTGTSKLSRKETEK